MDRIYKQCQFLHTSTRKCYQDLQHISLWGFFPIRNSSLKKGKPKPMKTNMYTRIYSTTSIYHIIKHHSESTSTIYRKTGKKRLKNINTDNFLLYQTSYFVSCDYSDKQKTSKDVHSSVLYNSSTKCRDET